jgi:protein-arginine kinase activator protein McsA
MTKIGHFVKPSDQHRIKCSDCNQKPATVCLYNYWTVQSRSGISFWYHCAACAKSILYREVSNNGQAKD